VKDHGRELRHWVIFAVVAIGACGGGGGGGPRDDEIVATIEAFWDAVGAPTDATFQFGYDYQTHKGTTSCQHLPEDDRWYAQRAAQLNPDVMTQDQLHQAAINYLDSEGYDVERYRTRSREAPVSLALIGRSNEMIVALSVEPNGSAELAVRAGPCAVPTYNFGTNLYERVE